MGKLEARQRLTVVRRLCGHESMEPSGVLVQSFDRTNLPISPPPTSQSFESTDSPEPGTLLPQAGQPRMSGKFSSEVSVAVAMTWAFRKRSPKGSSGCRAKDVSFGYDRQVAFEKIVPISCQSTLFGRKQQSGNSANVGTSDQ